MILGVILLIWSLLPIYNMFLIALDPEEGEIEFAGNLWTPKPSLDGFRDVITQQARYLEDFWHQFGNSLFIGLLTMVLTVSIGSLASFAVSRLRLSRSSLFTNAAAHLRDPRVLPDRPLLSDHAQLWALRYALGCNCSASDFRFAFRHPDFAAIRELNTARIG